MLSCAGNRYLKTPALDSLAAEGTRFEKAYCTNPVCSPSRFSLFTGRMPGEINLFYNEEELYRREPPREILEKGLGHLMRSAGYDTHYGGKEHMPSSEIADYGFNSICRDERDGLSDACVDFLKTPRDSPFFLTASFINPHDICFMAITEALKTKDPLDILAYQYDFVLNGFELTSGAIRNHDPKIMYKAFEIAGYTKEQVDKEFGHMIRAFEYGAPPHGGNAPGIDRLLMVLNDWDSIRDIYAFPKDGQGRDVMMDAPSSIDDKQLKLLGIKTVND